MRAKQTVKICLHVQPAVVGVGTSDIKMNLCVINMQKSLPLSKP